MPKATKKIIIRLYSAHDMDLLALSYNPAISFSKIALSAIRAYVRNVPAGQGWPYNVSCFDAPTKLSSRQYTIYLDKDKDADVIAFLDSCASINSMIRYAVRYYISKPASPDVDAINSLQSIPISETKAPTPKSLDVMQKVYVKKTKKEYVPTESYVPPHTEEEEARPETSLPTYSSSNQISSKEDDDDIEKTFTLKKNQTEGFGDNFMALFNGTQLGG